MTLSLPPARILAIAGSDSGGGAGIQADIRTITMLGGHAMTAITAVTAQNTLGVQAIHPVPVDIIAEQIASVIEDIGVDAIKIGMLPDAQSVAGVAGILLAARPVLARRAGGSPAIVVDPVLVSTSGARLAGDDVLDEYRNRLFPLATLITPNLPECLAFGGAAALADFSAHVLVKGGHAVGTRMVDLLYLRGIEAGMWISERIETPHTHGTGCTLASAIATGLGQGMTLDASIERARDYVRASILAAPGFGGGHGPMGVPRGFRQ